MWRLPPLLRNDYGLGRSDSVYFHSSLWIYRQRLDLYPFYLFIVVDSSRTFSLWCTEQDSPMILLSFQPCECSRNNEAIRNARRNAHGKRQALTVRWKTWVETILVAKEDASECWRRRHICSWEGQWMEDTGWCMSICSRQLSMRAMRPLAAGPEGWNVKITGTEKEYWNTNQQVD